MSILVEPKIIVPDIELEINENDEYAAQKIMDAFGPIIPVVKLKDYVLSAGEVKDYTFSVKVNKLSTFRITLIDTNFRIRKLLSDNEPDTIVIFLGNKIWYHKFEGIIRSVYSDAGDEELTLEGCIYIPKLYETIQRSYNNKSVKDVLIDVCTNTDIGLFTYENQTLSNVLTENLNPNKRYIDFGTYCLSKFTNNVWCIDNFYYMHVGDFETIKSKPIDTYLIKNGVKFDSEQPIVITTNKFADNVDYINNPELDNKLSAKYYTINSNIGNIHISNAKTYTAKDSAGNEKSVDNIDNFGIGTFQENYFDRFFDRNLPFYKDVVNKQLTGKSITLEMTDILYEIVPFQNIDVEIYFPRDSDEVNTEQKDLENSGKKTIIGYEIKYESPGIGDKYPNIQQTIEVI